MYMQAITRLTERRSSRAVALVRAFERERPGGASEDLRRARSLLDEIENERNRLIGQRMAASVGSSLFDAFDVLELRSRVTSTDALIAQLEDFASTDFPRMEAKALAGDGEQAARLVRGCERILAAARGTSMVSDGFDDARSLLVETLEDVKGAASIGFGFAAIAGLAYVAFMLR